MGEGLKCAFAATKATRKVRKFSMSGPCIVLGNVTGDSDKSVSYTDPMTFLSRNVKKSQIRASSVHLEPCVSCMDHPHTQYPNGYVD